MFLFITCYIDIVNYVGTFKSIVSVWYVSYYVSQHIFEIIYWKSIVQTGKFHQKSENCAKYKTCIKCAIGVFNKCSGGAMGWITFVNREWLENFIKQY